MRGEVRGDACIVLKPFRYGVSVPYSTYHVCSTTYRGVCMGKYVRSHQRATRGGTLQPPNDRIEPARHVILSSVRGVTTELEKLQEDAYIVRCHKSTADAGIVLDDESWVGFQYQDSHW